MQTHNYQTRTRKEQDGRGGGAEERLLPVAASTFSSAVGSGETLPRSPVMAGKAEVSAH